MSKDENIVHLFPGSDPGPDFDPDKLRLPDSQSAAKTAKPKRMPRTNRPFAIAHLDLLVVGGALNVLFPAPARLYFHLQYASRRGARPVRLTNKDATHLGLDRRAKMRALQMLEKHGIISVERVGRQNPRVTILAV